MGITLKCKWRWVLSVWLSGKMAERVGFEPTVGVNLHTLSKRAP